MLSYYRDVFNHYKDSSEKLMAVHKNVLKTDCYNEAVGRPIIKGKEATIIEFDPYIIEKALEANPELNIVQGDIRNMPFKDNEFDLILDLSTIDHIPPEDLDRTLKGYARICNGVVFIITWFGKRTNPKEWLSANQYFFDDEFITIANKYFVTKFNETIFIDRDLELKQFVLERL